ncbi:deoxyhypusine synthase [Candidatus Woesearchaeota archaeon]|nr:MAG: deoxyhypusine synthase [Candidatus Woesearchaeota archaeon]
MQLKPIKQISLEKKMSVNDLVNAMRQSNVMGAGKIAKATQIMEDMFTDKDCRVFLGVAGAMVPGGMKQVLVDMLKSDWIDVLVITGANLTHDLIEALGHSHYQGSHLIDDEELNKQGIDRIYDSFMKNEVYQTLEDFFTKIFYKLKDIDNIPELLWKIGENVEDRNSILNVCASKKIPIFCPAISDSGIGLMIWGRLAAGEYINVNAFADLKQIMQYAFKAKRTGVIYIGGGVPKNYIQQAMQFRPKEGADYGVQITMDRPEPGGSSGAELKESISWGKLSLKAKFVDVICDATIALPLMIAALKERINI